MSTFSICCYSRYIYLCGYFFPLCLGGGEGVGSDESLQAELGKHPDLLVGPPTATVFPTNDRKSKKPQFFEKIFEKI